jgi:hypothetical protein
MAAREHDPFWYEEFDTSHWFPSFFVTAFRVVAAPSRFYARLDPEGGYLTALAFALLCAWWYALLASVTGEIALARVEARVLRSGNVLANFARFGVAWTAVLVLLMPLLVAFYHAFVRAFAREHRQGYRATFRILYYALAPLLWIGCMPLVGPFAAAGWGVYLALVGVHQMHTVSTLRAIFAVIVPTLMVLLAVAAALFGVALVPLRGAS